MCIVVFDYDPTHEYPIRIGANREESVSRPVNSPIIDLFGVAKLVAGQDRGFDGTMRTPGTWLGVNNYGLTVAITNRDDGVLHARDQLHSRGVLCYDLLSYLDTQSAVKFAIKSLNLGQYGGCNYIIADRQNAWIVHSRGPGDIRADSLATGLHVLTNLDINDPEDKRVQFMQKNYQSSDPKPWLTAPEILMLDSRWGTISSSILKVHLHDVLSKSIFWHASHRPINPENYSLLLPHKTRFNSA